MFSARHAALGPCTTVNQLTDPAKAPSGVSTASVPASSESSPSAAKRRRSVSAGLYLNQFHGSASRDSFSSSAVRSASRTGRSVTRATCEGRSSLNDSMDPTLATAPTHGPANSGRWRLGRLGGGLQFLLVRAHPGQRVGIGDVRDRQVRALGPELPRRLPPAPRPHPELLAEQGH